VLVAAAALVLAASMLFAVGPALYATRVDPARAVGGGSRTATPRRGGRWRAGIVAAQMALAFPVFCAILALVQRFGQLSAAAAEYAPEHLLLSVPRAAGLDSGRYKDGAERARLWREFDAAIERVPGVLSTASTAPLALNRAVGAVVEPVGTGSSAEWRAQLRCASPDFFSTMKVPVVRGRTFTSTGALAGEPVAVVSESFARRYFGGTDPVGRRVRVKKSSPICPARGEPLEIVGVVRNTQLPDIQTGNADSPPTVYVSTELVTPRVSQFLVRTSVPASAVRRDVQRAIASVDPELVGRTRSLHEDVEEAFIQWPRLLVRAALTASVAALLLLVVGVSGVLAYSVAQLTREIGIRLALGATPALVGRQVLGRTLRWTTAGITVGAAAAFLLHRAVSSKVWGLSSVDLNVAACAVVVVLLSGLAAWLPTRRAMQVDPASMLKSE
jgi:predicted permease